MKILYLKNVDSTQTYLKELIKNKEVLSSVAVVSDMQTDGLGSRGNSWHSLDGNLFVSFCISLDDLVDDLKLESSSIYFTYILKMVLEEFGSKCWIKWPNDFYIDDKKIGGMISNIVENFLICGIGLNLQSSPSLEYGQLDIKLDREVLLNKYFELIEKKILWKQVFSKYKLEFYKNKNYFTHNNNSKISFENTSLDFDGSIICNGERIYSLR